HMLPQEHMYWEQSPDTGTTLISESMSRKRYKDIKRFIHCNDNTNIDKEDRFFKVRPLIRLLNEGLQQFGFFEDCLSIDERMVKYFGRHGCKMYMKGKPCKFGYKFWVLASHDGYPFNIIPYQGSSKVRDVPLSQEVVLSLLEPVPDPSCHRIYMDNFFSSF